MPLHPAKYAEMLGGRIKEHAVKVWLVNTGWTGGCFGVGRRIKLVQTRAIISAALEGKLDHVDYENHEIFNVAIPKNCPGVPIEILNPQNTWQDERAYCEQANRLAGLFISNFKQYEGTINKEILASAPVLKNIF
jgi:phosphoenolpyruvate carboxykinase (ATP)